MKVARDTIEDCAYPIGGLLPMTRLSLLMDLASLLSREVDLDALLSAACTRMADALRAERATIWLVDAEQGDLSTRVAVLPEVPSLRLALGQGIAGWVASKGTSVRVQDVASDSRFDHSADETTGYVTRSMLAVPIREEGDGPVRGVVQVLNRLDGSFDADDEQYLEALALQLGRALAMTTLRADDATGPGVVNRGRFNHIVGRSDAMDAVYERIGLAARADAAVLLRGETGTGKSLLARAIHVNSGRQGGPFVTVDCTTLPRQLVESELFGHERGAFTGAERRVLGRVELAEGGTLFLDEIGDLPLEMQGKLLRFLQERQFMRVGGRENLTANVRIICATHRDLDAEVKAGRFREDLFYRIKVVGIRVPPLRDRGPDEIETLARHFSVIYAERYERPKPSFSDEALLTLRAHAWPGNVRELEHWVESAVVLSTDGVLRGDHLVQLPPGSPTGPAGGGGGVHLPRGLSLEEVQRRYIAATVDECDGNRTEAARSLGIGRNTITRKLGSE
jgi:DNA-binding NtrC family response regulator